MGVDSTPNHIFPLVQELPNKLAGAIQNFQNQVDAIIGPGGTVTLREIDSDHVTIPTIDATDVGSFIYNVNTTPNNLAVQGFGNDGGYQAYIGAQMLGPGATDGAGLFWAVRPIGGANPKEHLRLSSEGVFTYDAGGFLGTETDLSSWAVSKFRLTGSVGSEISRYLMAIQPYAVVSDGGSYESCGILVQAKTRDPSAGGDKDMVGIDTHCQIVDGNMLGRAWGFAAQASCEVGSDGRLCAAEFAAGGGSDQPLINTTTTKYVLHVVAAGVTAGIAFLGSGGSLGFHKMIYANPADILATHADDSFILLKDTWRVTKEGFTFIDSPASPLNSQLRITANGLGALSFLNYNADNNQIGFDVDWSGGSLSWIARATSSAWITKGANSLSIKGSSSNTLGGAAAQNVFVTVDLTNGYFGIGTAPGNLLHVNSGATPSVQQMRVTANGLGSIGLLAYAADNVELKFDSEWTGNQTIARHTSSASIVKLDGMLTFRGSTGLTLNNPFIPTDRMTLDLSNGNFGIGTAPAAKFHVLSTTEQLRLGYDASNYTSFTVGAGGNLTVSPTGDYIFDPVGKDILPNANYDLNIGALSKKYLTLHAAELWVQTIVAQETVATIGGRILVGPSTILTSDLASGATSILVKHNQMVSGDRVYLEANGFVEFMAITSGPSGSGPYSYSVTRDLDGSGANDWPAGSTVVNTGTTGNGFIDIYSVRGVKSASQAGPTIVGNVRTGTTYNQWAEHWAIGNLDGLYGYGVTTFGVAFGKYAASVAHITIDATNGYRTFSGLSTVVQQIDNSGNITVGEVAASKANTYISAGALAIRLNTTALFSVDTSGNVTVGEVGASKANTYISAGALSMRVNTTPYFNIDTSGNVTLGNVATDQGNAFWNASNKRLEFRGSTAGTVVQAYVDTAGAISAGAGAVSLDVNGLNFVSGAGVVNRAKWYTGTKVIGYVGASRSGSTETFFNIIGDGNTGTDATGLTSIEISAISSNTGASASIDLTSFGASHATFPSATYVVVSWSGSTGGMVVGFGLGYTTAAAATLDVRGTGLFSDTVTISNTAPSLVLSDTTASAKDLTIKVDANLVQFRESAAADGSLMVLDLANNRVGIGTASPATALEVNGSITIGSGASVIINSTGTVRNISFLSNSPFDSIGQLCIYPPAGTNVKAQIAVSPRGTGFSATSKAEILVYNTDAVADLVNQEWFGMRAIGSDGYLIGSGKIGTGSNRAITFAAGWLSDGTTNANQLHLATSGKVGIGGVPATSGALDVQSTTGAFIPPRMTTTQRDALTAVDGMLVYNSTTGALNYRKAGAWVAI